MAQRREGETPNLEDKILNPPQYKKSVFEDYFFFLFFHFIELFFVVFLLVFVKRSFASIRNLDSFFL